MARKKSNAETVQCKHFTWRLRQRSNGVWQADGRRSNTNLPRQSLGTKDLDEARQLLHAFDQAMAVKLGLAEPEKPVDDVAPPVLLEDGCQIFLKHVGRPRVLNGARHTTVTRYQAPLNKFVAFARETGVFNWNEVTAAVLEDYARRLEQDEYAYPTLYLELTVLKQVNKLLVEKKHLPADCRIALSLRKPSKDSNRYCWSVAEFHAMLAYCRNISKLNWLHDVILALGLTGLRISELLGLRRSEVDLNARMIRLVDESTQGNGHEVELRTTKGGYGRSFPIHPELFEVFKKMAKHTDGLMFHGPDRRRIEGSDVRKALRDEVIANLKAQFPSASPTSGFEHGCPHSFRHFFCSLCANSGVPEFVVMKWLGHRHSDIVKRYYHLHDDESHRQMLRLDPFQSVDGDVAADEE